MARTHRVVYSIEMVESALIFAYHSCEKGDSIEQVFDKFFIGDNND